MEKNIAIKVENLSKAYQLGQIGTGTISRDLERFWTTKIRGKEDPFLKIGQTNDRTVKGESDIVWSLKDINFEIEQGDAVGIIGRNGAGKSTLLKLLSRVTAPTAGNIKVKGRIASLLEVGTGFHPELTGRENIYLNGAILGMRKKEIARKFDEIVDFSGVERYIDTPVKRYSSGMYVRLAFAVAAHLESEILIVDEVLSVGDAEFQKKCLGKMSDVSKGEGRTVLFVSHNMDSINKLCNNGIYLKNGINEYQGYIENTVNKYLINNFSNKSQKTYNKLIEDIFLISAQIKNDKNQIGNNFRINENWKIEIQFEVKNRITNYVFAIGLLTFTEFPINTSWSNPIALEKGSYTLEFEIDDLPLQAGQYRLVFGIAKNKKSMLYDDDFLIVEVENITSDGRIQKADGTTGILAKQFNTKTTANGYI
jgi:lipopolysaccharide transport system ATP-binding protein